MWVNATGHTNVVPIYDAGIHARRVYIVSEYVEEGSLADKIRTRGGLALSVDEATHVVKGILAGLGHLHHPLDTKKIIVHRDLKPANVLLQKGMARLTDFGLALEGPSLSRSAAGTLRYIAPEALCGQSGPSVNLWAAGVILYELLAGHWPFARERRQSDDAILYAILHQAPVPLPPTVPPVLAGIVLQALQKDPLRRFASAGRMSAAINQCARFSIVPSAPWQGDDAGPPHSPQVGAHRGGRTRSRTLLVIMAIVVSIGTPVTLVLTGVVGPPWDPPPRACYRNKDFDFSGNQQCEDEPCQRGPRGVLGKFWNCDDTRKVRLRCDGSGEISRVRVDHCPRGCRTIPPNRDGSGTNDVCNK